MVKTSVNSPPPQRSTRLAGDVLENGTTTSLLSDPKFSLASVLFFPFASGPLSPPPHGRPTLATLPVCFASFPMLPSAPPSHLLCSLLHRWPATAPSCWSRGLRQCTRDREPVAAPRRRTPAPNRASAHARERSRSRLTLSSLPSPCRRHSLLASARHHHSDAEHPVERRTDRADLFGFCNSHGRWMSASCAALPGDGRGVNPNLKTPHSIPGPFPTAPATNPVSLISLSTPFRLDLRRPALALERRRPISLFSTGVAPPITMTEMLRCLHARVVGWRLELLLPSQDEQNARRRAMRSGSPNAQNRENVR